MAPLGGDQRHTSTALGSSGASATTDGGNAPRRSPEHGRHRPRGPPPRVLPRAAGHRLRHVPDGRPAEGSDTAYPRRCGLPGLDLSEPSEAAERIELAALAAGVAGGRLVLDPGPIEEVPRHAVVGAGVERRQVEREEGDRVGDPAVADAAGGQPANCHGDVGRGRGTVAPSDQRDDGERREEVARGTPPRRGRRR